MEQGKQPLLLRHMPTAIARREAVGVVPAQFVDTLLQYLLHAVGTFLGNDRSEGIGNKDAHHIIFLLQPLLELLEGKACRTNEKGVCLGSSELAFNDASHLERGQVASHKEAELRFYPRTDMIDYKVHLPYGRLIGLLVTIAHLLVNVGRDYL